MPSWVKDEKKWKEAKAIAERQYDIGEDNPDFYKVVTGIYKKMGGEMSKSFIFVKAHVRRHNRKLKSGKVVVVREHDDKRIKQMKFDFAGMYSDKDIRPGTTATQKKLGIAAGKDIERHIIGSRAKNKHGVSLLASDLCKDFVEHGKINLVGQSVKTPKDLAALAQVYRDPRFETFRVFYTQKNQIVGECAYSCRAPGIVAFDDDFFDLIGKDKDRFEADGYWLLHNHPSGSAEPSGPDITTTSRIRSLVPGFKGHVVIDHNEYAFINSNDKAKVFKDDSLGGVDFGKNPAVDHNLLGLAISDPKHVAFAAKILQSLNQLDNPVLVITKGSRGVVSLVASVPPGAIPDSRHNQKDNAKAAAWLRSVGRKTGSGSRFFLIVTDKMLDASKKKYADLIRGGIVLDVVTESGRSMQMEGAFSSRHESVWDERIVRPARRKIVATMKKAHPIQQAVISKPDDLNDIDVRRNPGEPSPDKAKADNYAKPVKKWHGLSIRIENPAGSIRRGKSKCGHSWETRMVCDYGYIARTEGVDGDEVDVYLGPDESAPMVYVIHQRKYNDWSAYDEDKCMLGFDSEESAVAAYLQHYDDERFLGPVTAMPFSQFKEKVMQTKENPAMIKGMILILKSMVSSHTRRLKSGKVIQVRGYTDKRTKKTEASDKQNDLFGNDVHVMPKKEAVDEHKRLVAVLKSPSHADDKKEAKKQAKELKEIQAGGKVDERKAAKEKFSSTKNDYKKTSNSRKKSFSEWLEDADMPEKRNGEWVDLETGLTFSDWDHAKADKFTIGEKAKAGRELAKLYGGKALTGTPKQKEWAEKIRAEKLIGLDDDTATFLSVSKLADSAKFWIDMKDMSSNDIFRSVTVANALSYLNSINLSLHTRDMREHGNISKLIDSVLSGNSGALSEAESYVSRERDNYKDRASQAAKIEREREEAELARKSSAEPEIIKNSQPLFADLELSIANSDDALWQRTMNKFNTPDFQGSEYVRNKIEETKVKRKKSKEDSLRSDSAVQKQAGEKSDNVKEVTSKKPPIKAKIKVVNRKKSED